MRLVLALKAFFRVLKGSKEPQQQIIEHKGDNSHLRLLNMLQESSRFIDFLKEDISGFSDEQIGAVVRKIHEQSSKTIEETVTIRPILEEKEGKTITVSAGYDPSEIKIVGKVKGEPPFDGILRHKGWKAHKLSLPKQITDTKKTVIYQAEVEIL